MMQKILVASSKGGCGKTTIATTVAGYFSQDGKRTVLVDADRQGSSLRWAEKRAATSNPVLGLSATRRDWPEKIPADAQRVIIDGPAGIRIPELTELLDHADALIIPVLPSRIDLEATEAFLRDVADIPRVKRGKVPVGLVANRLKPWTTASQEAVEEIKKFPFPLIAQLRDTQGYIVVAGLGKSIFDYNSETIRSHQEDWEKIVRWLKKHG